MAVGTVPKVNDTFIQMLSLNLGRDVFMASVAGVALELIGMASPARADGRCTVTERELVDTVKERRQPAGRSVASGAIGTQSSEVKGRLRMTPNTGLGRADKDLIHMTALAGQVYVGSGKGENG
jgi:hypothetical protein